MNFFSPFFTYFIKLLQKSNLCNLLMLNVLIKIKNNTFNRLSGEFNSWKNTLGMFFFPNIPLANALALCWIKQNLVHYLKKVKYMYNNLLHTMYEELMNGLVRSFGNQSWYLSPMSSNSLKPSLTRNLPSLTLAWNIKFSRSSRSSLNKDPFLAL